MNQFLQPGDVFQFDMNHETNQWLKTRTGLPIEEGPRLVLSCEEDPNATDWIGKRQKTLRYLLPSGEQRFCIYSPAFSMIKFQFNWHKIEIIHL